MDNSFWMKSVAFVTACTLIVPAPTFATLTDTSLVQESISAEVPKITLPSFQDASGSASDVTSERNVVLGTQVSAAVLQDSEDHVVEIDLPDDQTPDMDQQSSSPKQDAEHAVQSTTSIASEASTASHDATVQYAIVGDHSVEIHLPASEVEQVMATQSDNAHTSTETTQTDQPSMIADRSDEGQPLTQGTTFRGGEKKQTKKFYTSGGFDFNVKFLDDGTIDMNDLKNQASDVGLIPTKAEIVVMNEEEILMVTNDGSTKSFFANPSSIFIGTLNGGKALTDTVKSDFDLSEGVTVSWKKAFAFPKNSKHKKYNLVKKDGKIIGYTIKLEGKPVDSNFVWAFVPSKKYQDEQNSAPVPTLKTATFYTSTGKSFAVVLKDDGTLDIEKNKELAQTHYADNQEVLDTIKKVKQAEIVDFDGESMLFALLDDNSMKGFAGAENSKFQLAFKADGASSMDGTIVPNLTTVKKASWVDEKLPIQKYREIKNGDTVIGYTFQNEAHHWFYAPATVKETKAFYTSTNTEFKVVLKEDKTVDVEATKIYLAPLKEKLPDDLKALADSATDADVVIEEINGVHILFVDLKTSTKAFADQQDSAFKNAFNDGTSGEPFYDATTIIKAHWVDSSKEITHYNEIKNGSEVIGYTLKNKDNDWFYAQKRNVTQTPFYTSNDKPFPVILRADGQSVNFEDTKKLLIPMIPLLSDDLKAEAQDFADNATADKVEIKTIEGVKILFVRTAPHTKAFFASPTSIFQNAFKGGNADLSKIKYDLTKAEAANWVDTTKTITAYNPITKDGEVIGYALKNKDNDWFYAPLRLDIVNFYGSNNGKLEIVMQDENAVDLAQTKKLLVPQIPRLPANLQEEAQDFADNATDADVVIKEIEGVKLLFAKTSKHTKVFRTPDTDTMFQNAFKEGKVMNIGVVYTDAIVKPDWVDTSKKVTHYNEIKKADKVIGYALKTEDHHWFYAPKKEFTITPFYTSNNNIVPVVMKDPMTIDLPATKSVLYPLIKDITNPKDKAFAETFIKTATEKDVEIKKIEDVKVLFVNLGTSTKAFAGEASSPFQNAFKEGTAINVNIVYHSPIKPTWATSSDVKKYNEIKKANKLIGYTLKDADNHWFYAPAAYRVNFDTDGATAIADQSIPLDGKATKPTDPSKAGYRFDGWFADKAFKTAFDFTKVITEHTTVYAKWTRITSGGGSSGGGSSGGSSSYTPIQPNTSTEVKGDEAIRLFGTFTGSVHSLIKTLDDPRLKEFMEQYGIPVSQMNVGMTRGEVVKYLVQITKHDVEKLDTSFLKYPDIGTKHAYRKYIAFATKHNIVSGYPDGTFRSHAIISRAELVKILVNAIGYRISEEKTHFADVPASHTLRRYIHTAYIFGLVHGVTKNTFEPNRSVTYGEFSKMMYNILHSK